MVFCRLVSRCLSSLAAPAAILAVQAGAAFAQTDDPAFGRWRFTPEPLGARPAGLGGAFVAVADDGRAAVANPAGIALVPSWEAVTSSLRTWAGLAGGWRGLRLAAYGWGAGAQGIPIPGGAAGAAAGRLTSTVTELGLAAGLSPLPRLSVGVAASWTEMHLRSEFLADAAEAASLAGEPSPVRWTAGMLVDLTARGRSPISSLRLGVAVQPGFDWSVDRTAPGAAPRVVAIRRPTVASVGLAWRPAARWLLSGETDLIRHREVVRTLRRNVGQAADGMELPDRVEPHLGVEFATHLSCGCGNVRLRAGVRGRSPGLLHYTGTDPSRARAFPGEPWRAVATLGGSFVGEYFGRALRLDLDSTDLLDGPRLSAGVSMRF